MTQTVQAHQSRGSRKASSKAAVTADPCANSEAELFLQSEVGLYGPASWRFRKPDLYAPATTQVLHAPETRPSVIATPISAPSRRPTRKLAGRASIDRTRTAQPRRRATKGRNDVRPEMKREFGVFVGLGNALLLEAILVLAILAIWYGTQTAFL
jgi:hypothetical protein